MTSWRGVAGAALSVLTLATQGTPDANAKRVEATGSAGDIEISLSTDKTRHSPDDTAHFLINLTRAGRPIAGHEVHFGAVSLEDIYSTTATTSPNGYALTSGRGELRFTVRFTAGPAKYSVFAGAGTGEPGERARARIQVDARRPFYLRWPFVAGVLLASIVGVALAGVRRRRADSD